MDKYEQLKQKIEEIKTKSLVAEEMKAFVALVLKIVKETKDDLKDTSKENLKTIAEAVKYVEQEHDKVLDSVSRETKSVKIDFTKQVKELKDLVEQVKAMKPQDGKDADEEKIVDKVLEKIVLPDYKETILDDRPKIIEKINSGKKNDVKIELKQIEGTDKFKKDISDWAIGVLDQRTQFLINKGVKHDSTLSGAGTDASPLSVVSSGGGTWGSITGTLSNQTDLQDALDDKASTLASLSTLSTDTAKSLYTMSTNVDVEFEDDGGNTVLYLDESTARVGIGTTNPGGKLEVQSGTLTTSAPILLAQTWNASAVFEGVKIAITQTSVGNSGSTLFSILGGTLGTTPYLSIDRTGYTLLSNSVTGQYTALLLRNSHAAANDTVDIDFEITTSNPLARIGAIRTNRAVSGDTDLTFSTFSNGSLAQKWKITDQGNFLATTDNTYDIGASGATRPRALYLAGAFTNPALSTSGTNATFNGNVATIGGGQYAFAGRGQLTAPSNGVWKISDSTDADFNRLQLGGVSSSYPSIKRSSATLAFRLADDSADASITAAGALFSGDVGITGTRVPKGWFTDLESTNMPTVGGTSLSSTFAPIASPTFTGTVTIPASISTGQNNLDGTPASDHTAVGNVTNTFASGYSSAIGDLVFFGSGGKWLEVDSDAVATCNGLLGIALEAKADTEAMLVALPGSFVRDDSWNWTVGATLYAGETLGAMQETIPTGADAIIKVVGFAVTADIIFFNPSPDQQSTVA